MENFRFSCAFGALGSRKPSGITLALVTLSPKAKWKMAKQQRSMRKQKHHRRQSVLYLSCTSVLASPPSLRLPLNQRSKLMTAPWWTVMDM